MDIISAIPGSIIAYITNGKLYKKDLPESESEMLPLFKQFEGHPLGNKNTCCIQINEFNSERKDLIFICKKLDINYKLVKESDWVKFHGIFKRKEIGIDYKKLLNLDEDMRHLRSHLNIENNVKNHEVVTNEAIHMLDTNEKLNARKKLCDNYIYLSKEDLRKSIKEVEVEISKIKSLELIIKKNRYKDYANKIYIKSQIGDSKKRINRLENELGIRVNDFLFNNVSITPAELRKLFKWFKLKPLTLHECDAVLLLLYQMNS